MNRRTIQCFNAVEKNDAPLHVRQNYTLALEDNFSGGQLDASKWSTELLWGEGTTINKEEQYYVNALDPNNTYPDPFIFNAAGNLEITATPITGTKPVTTNGIAGGQNYWSGVMHTRDSLSFKYGYAECCVKMPGTFVDGAWPANWLLNRNYYDNAFLKNQAENGGVGNDKFNPEIDFTEQVHGPGYFGANRSKMAYHYFTGDKNSTNYSLWTLDGGNFKEVDVATGNTLSNFNIYTACNGATFVNLPDFQGIDLSQDFHTYGVDWTPEHIHYYLDGNIVNCIETESIISDQQMYLILNFAVGGSFPFGNTGALANPNDYPASMEVNYVRIYTYN